MKKTVFLFLCSFLVLFVAGCAEIESIQDDVSRKEKIEIDPIIKTWLEYSVTADNSSGEISFSWNVTSEEHIKKAELWVNSTNSSNVYYNYSAADNGSLTYMGVPGKNYIVKYRVESLSGRIFG